MSSEIEVAQAIVKAAMKGVTQAHIDKVEDSAWTTIESQIPGDRAASIRFAYDTGVVSIEHKFLTTKKRELAIMLWNEFADEIVDPDTGKVTEAAIAVWADRNADMAEWKRELVDAPRALKPANMAWHDKQLKRGNLPLRVASVQFGEIFGGKIEWEDTYYRDIDIEWSKDDNGGMGIKSDIGECYQGWDSEHKVYLLHKDLFSNNEKVMRIAL